MAESGYDGMEDIWVPRCGAVKFANARVLPKEMTLGS